MSQVVSGRHLTLNLDYSSNFLSQTTFCSTHVKCSSDTNVAISYNCVPLEKKSVLSIVYCKLLSLKIKIISKLL